VTSVFVVAVAVVVGFAASLAVVALVACVRSRLVAAQAAVEAADAEARARAAATLDAARALGPSAVFASAPPAASSPPPVHLLPGAKLAAASKGPSASGGGGNSFIGRLKAPLLQMQGLSPAPSFGTLGTSSSRGQTPTPAASAEPSTSRGGGAAAPWATMLSSTSHAHTQRASTPPATGAGHPPPETHLVVLDGLELPRMASASAGSQAQLIPAVYQPPMPTTGTSVAHAPAHPSRFGPGGGGGALAAVTSTAVMPSPFAHAGPGSGLGLGLGLGLEPARAVSVFGPQASGASRLADRDSINSTASLLPRRPQEDEWGQH
jgi:hypothetical protein